MITELYENSDSVATRHFVDFAFKIIKFVFSPETRQCSCKTKINSSNQENSANRIIPQNSV